MCGGRIRTGLYIPTNPFVLCQRTKAIQQTGCSTVMHALLPLAAGLNKALTTCMAQCHFFNAQLGFFFLLLLSLLNTAKTVLGCVLIPFVITIQASTACVHTNKTCILHIWTTSQAPIQKCIIEMSIRHIKITCAGEARSQLAAESHFPPVTQQRSIVLKLRFFILKII